MPVDCIQLPDGTLRPGRALDVEGVHADELTGMVGPAVALGLVLARWLVRRRVSRDEAQSRPARVESVPAQAAPVAVVADDEDALALRAKLGRDPCGAEFGMAQGEGNDPLFDKRRELSGHAQHSPLARAQDLQALALDHPLPAVVGRAAHPERAAGSAHADPSARLTSCSRKPKSTSSSDIGSLPFLRLVSNARVSRQRARPGSQGPGVVLSSLCRGYRLWDHSVTVHAKVKSELSPQGTSANR